MYITETEKEEPGCYNCVGCRCDWTDKNCLIEHVINDHRVYFCLNCEDWVKDKSKVLDENWTMFDERGKLRYDVEERRLEDKKNLTKMVVRSTALHLPGLRIE